MVYPSLRIVRRMYKVEVFLRVRRVVMGGWDEGLGSLPGIRTAPGHCAQNAGLILRRLDKSNCQGHQKMMLTAPCQERASKSGTARRYAILKVPPSHLRV